MNNARSFFLFSFCSACIIFCFYGCKKWNDYHYKVVGLDLYNARYLNGSAVDVNDNSAITNAYYILRLEYSEAITGSTKQTNSEESQSKLDNYATSFNITSSSGFDADHPANSSLNDCFLYGFDQQGPGTQACSLSDAVAKHYIGESGVPTGYSAPTGPWKTSDFLVLKKLTNSTGSREFTVEIHFQDNTSVTKTINVYLN